MRTPSVSSIRWRFSSRVPKRGSRLGVISKAIFNGFDGSGRCGWVDASMGAAQEGAEALAVDGNRGLE